MAHIALKHTLRQLLDQGQLEQIAEMAATRRRILKVLISLTYDEDPQICWRAVEAQALAAVRIANDDPAYVREHLRRLFWLITEESGGICWHAPEAIAEVVHHMPALFGEYIPIVVTLILELAEEDLEHFRPGALWAIGRVGALAGDHVQEVMPAIAAALKDPKPQSRGMAVWCLGELGQAAILTGRQDLLSDEGPVDLYEDRVLKRTTVAQLASRLTTDY
jgi:methylated-DNA-[protein]-cysteine S-methyltransferase